MSMMNINLIEKFLLSFDIGHSSIGWAILKTTQVHSFPEVVASGCLIFDDSCLAKKRGSYRRMRKHIASVRNRIKRLRSVFESIGVMTREELDSFKSNHPWLLAARVLASGGETHLTWPELWAVIRYYAHNRGYDGNQNWAKNGDSVEDAKKCKAAVAMMTDLKKETSVETMCAFLGVDPLSDKISTLKKYFKGNNVAFPREIVVKEVESILDAHIGRLPKCDANFKELIIGNWRDVVGNGINLPKHFTSDSGILFGQYVPRFDNRIISKCPLCGKKVPTKHCLEYLDFRWKMLMSNIGLSIGRFDATKIERLDEMMKLYGSLSKTTLKRLLSEIFEIAPANFENMFLTEEMEDALILDPVKKAILYMLCPNIARTLPDAEKVKRLWNAIPKFVFTQMFRLKTFSLAQIASLTDSSELENAAIDIFAELVNTGKNQLTFGEVFNSKISISKISGRAPYARELMREASKQVMRGIDPRAQEGAIYRSADADSAEIKLPIDSWTNNHLVRHRLKMFQRLYNDIVNNFLGGDKDKVESVAIEVIKDLTSFSGLNIKEKAREIEKLVRQHKNISEFLEKEYPNLETSGGIIRKARIADDMAWKCPYTNKTFSPQELLLDGTMELEHIIPRSVRPSDSLDSLVLTWKEVNDFKGKRTAYEFIKECQGQCVPGRTNLCIVSLKQYEDFVGNLKVSKYSSKSFGDERKTNDEKRVAKRKKLLLTSQYDKRNSEFLPSDLTQTSHINKLAFRAVRQLYAEGDYTPKFVHTPGSVTSAVRKNWNLMPCIGDICPEIFKSTSNGGKYLKTKDEIRDITHLHHAIDAITIGISAVIFPKTKSFNEAVVKRHPNSKDIEELKKTGLFVMSQNGSWKLIELDSHILGNVKDKISETRVVKHVPAKMSGLGIEETLWGIIGETEKGTVKIRQFAEVKDGKFRRSRKITEEPKSKLLGYMPKNAAQSKLARNKAVIVIRDNFGIALEPTPEVIPFHNVWERIKAIADKNAGIYPRILRAGQLIKVSAGKMKGVWRIISVTNDARQGPLINIIHPAYVKHVSGTSYSKRNVSVNTLLKNNMLILTPDLSGIE